jgi:hypothetical protein
MKEEQIRKALNAHWQISADGDPNAEPDNLRLRKVCDNADSDDGAATECPTARFLIHSHKSSGAPFFASFAKGGMDVARTAAQPQKLESHPSCLLRRVGWRVLAQQQRHKSGAHLRDSLIVAKVGIVRNATVFFVPTIGSKLQAEVPITPIPGNFGPIGRVGDHAGRVLFACEREPIGRGAGRARHRYNCLQNIAIEHFGAARGRKVYAKPQLFR